MANNKTPQVFFCSDTHYNHSNICRGISKWEGKKGTRDFDTLEEMNDAIVKGINDKVMPDDILYHLGDWSFGGFDSIKEFRDRINCKNIHLILGNHDHHIARNKNDVTKLFTTVSHYREKKIGGQMIIMSHYPMHVWNHHYQGSWMLFGHCHGSLNPKHLGGRKTMDIGIDCTPDFAPIHIDELKRIMASKSIVFVDHHDSATTNHQNFSKD